MTLRQSRRGHTGSSPVFVYQFKSGVWACLRCSVRFPRVKKTHTFLREEKFRGSPSLCCFPKLSAHPGQSGSLGKARLGKTRHSNRAGTPHPNPARRSRRESTKVLEEKKKKIPEVFCECFKFSQLLICLWVLWLLFLPFWVVFIPVFSPLSTRNVTSPKRVSRKRDERQRFVTRGDETFSKFFFSPLIAAIYANEHKEELNGDLDATWLPTPGSLPEGMEEGDESVVTFPAPSLARGSIPVHREGWALCLAILSIRSSRAS